MPRALLPAVLAAALLATACASLPPDELAERYREPNLANLGLDQPDDDRATDADSSDGVDDPTPDAVGPLDTAGPSPEGRPPRDKALPTESTECWFDTEGYTVECGHIDVPSETAGVDPVQISFARFKASASDVHADPVIYLHGGPGGSILESADVFAPSIVDPFIDTRDVVLYDQRGAGESSPLPICIEAWELDDRFFASAEPHADIEDAYYTILGGCGERVGRRGSIDLSEYNSTVNADDLLDLIRALGFESVNLYGNSYGSRLAQTVMRDHPDHVRSVILAGVYPIEENLIGAVPETFRAALDAVFVVCAADPDCNERLPDPWATLDAVVDRLDADPVEFTVTGVDVAAFELAIAGDDLVNLLHGLLYSADGAALIPDLLVDLENGDTNRIRRVGPDAIYDTAGAIGWMAVQCREEAPFTTPEQAAEAGRADTPWHRVSLAPGLIGSLLLEACPLFPTIGEALPLENEPVAWNQPTLVLAGAFDPITPPWWAASVAERLPNASLLTFANRGHDADEGPCVAALMRTFVDDPTAPVSQSCADSAPPLQLTNTPEVLVSPLDGALRSSTFDIDPGSGTDEIDILLPDWPVDVYETENAFWRSLDQWDPTLVVVRSGPWAPGEITWYIEAGDRTDFSSTTTPGNVSARWERLEFVTGGADAVSYVIEEDGFALNVSVIGAAWEIEQLERAILQPIVESVALP